MAGPTTSFTAVVLAADRAPGDPVAKAAGASCKALAPIGGTPMVLRVLTALGRAQEVESRVLCGPPWAAVDENVELRSLIASGEVKWVRPEATPSASASAVMRSIPEDVPVLLTTADHALLSSRAVDYFCSEARAKGCDLVVGLASHELIASAYPQTKRTVMRLQDGGYCGCNLYAFLTPRARAAAAFWRRVERQRKNPLRLIGTLGWVPVLRYLMGRLSLGAALAGISARMGLTVGAVMMPFPESALDVDKVSDWTLVQSIIGEQGV